MDEYKAKVKIKINFIKCLKREKDIQAKLEKIVRQLMLDKLNY